MGWERMPVSKNVVLHLIFMLAALFQAFLHKTVKVLVQTKNNNNKSAVNNYMAQAQEEKHKLNQQSSSFGSAVVVFVINISNVVLALLCRNSVLKQLLKISQNYFQIKTCYFWFSQLLLKIVRKNG